MVRMKAFLTGGHMADDTKVAVLGTGIMGAAMARNLLSAGMGVRRLEDSADEARRIVDETTYRVWRLYMSGSAHDFQTGWINVYQALLLRPDRGESGLPLTRADWYS
jgi:glycine/D-amino acid oxidase-like deaminating enzyme